jgi:cystathionine beta-lyase/cystathionine gamma-synthase
VRADFEELLFLCHSAEAKLTEADVELRAAALHEPTRELLLAQLSLSRRRYSETAARLLSLRERSQCVAPSCSLVAELAAEKASAADMLRVEQALMAALVGAADWQSPSFLHSILPAAGRQGGRIRAHWNDYKRDRHLDADAYERCYLEAMVDGQAGLRALLTSCGMAAFTTVLSFLSLEGRLDGPVVAGAGLYNETRLLLERSLPGRIRFVDERDTPALLRAIDELRPSAIFLDSLSNTTWMAVPELAPLLARLRGTGTYLILDNTCLSVACQPFALADASVRLIVFESLLKYHQLGLDRANAGVIVARADDGERLAHYREHLGTNVGDVAVHTLPQPNRQALERRLARLQRNARFLAQHLHAHPRAGIHIVYPGKGACLSVVLRDDGSRLDRQRQLVEAAVAEAAKRGAALLAGSSFGFDTTRIYQTAARAEFGDPFVRIAAGTEHRLALETIAEALAAAIDAVPA